jgi:hypothetical protein
LFEGICGFSITELEEREEASLDRREFENVASKVDWEMLRMGVELLDFSSFFALFFLMPQ